jgi:hypothetical protein
MNPIQTTEEKTNVEETSAGLTPMQERLLLLILAVIQFTHVMDFVVMMPLGDQLRQAFAIDARQFGLLVSAYTFSAGIFGFVAPSSSTGSTAKPPCSPCTPASSSARSAAPLPPRTAS